MNRFALCLLLPLAACQQGADDATTAAGGGEPAATAAKAAQLFTPGQWEAKTTITAVEMPGVPAEAAASMVGRETAYSHCMMKDEAERSPGDLFRGAAKGECKYQRFDMAGGTIDARMECANPDDPGATTIEMAGSYSRDSYDMTMQMSVAAPGTPDGVKMKATTAGRRTGACI